MPIAAVAPTVATLAEKLARPPPSRTWSAAKALDLAGRPIDADPRAHLEGMPLDAALELLIAVVRKPDRAAGKEHRRQRDVERERRVVASAESAADIGELRVDARRLERARGLRRAGTRPTPRPRTATARRARARDSCRPRRTRRGRIPARETSGRRIGSRIRGRAPGASGLFAASSARICSP